MTREEAQLMAHAIAIQLAALIGNEEVYALKNHVIPAIVGQMIRADKTIDELDIAIGHPNPVVAMLIYELVRHEGWFIYYSLVDKVAC